MSTTAAAPAYPQAGEKQGTGIWSWLTTVDHKRIGILYLVTAMVWFIVGGLEAILIRIQLQQPYTPRRHQRRGGREQCVGVLMNAGQRHRSETRRNKGEGCILLHA
jgi:hypothetical protein